MRKKGQKADIETLNGMALFSGCTNRELTAVTQLGTVVSVADRATLTTQGELGHEFVLIMNGRARCTIDQTDVATYGPGDFFGELSLLDGGPRTATVVADGEATITVYSGQEFYGLLDVSPSIGRNMLIELARRYRGAPPSPRRAHVASRA